MCTLTYLPLGANEFILTTNRDESPDRAQASFPAYIHLNEKQILFPQDPKAGGTWIATSDKGVTICLLNGADAPHAYEPPYKISRGKVVLEAIECISPLEFFKNYDFNGIEPFTMIVLHRNPTLELIKFKWNGQSHNLSRLSATEPHIWASAQLYTKKARQNRKEWFDQWLQENQEFTNKAIIDFHKNAGSGDLKNDMIMDRGVVKTVSITSVAALPNNLIMTHENLISQTAQEIQLSHS